MEGFLFVVEPIWWEGSFPIISILIAATIAMAYVVYRFMKDMKPLIESGGEDFIFTAEQDENWTEKTIGRLRSYLESLYFPTQTSAHTVGEIRQYLKNEKLISILERIERAEYNNEDIPKEERTFINQELLHILPTLGEKNTNK